MSDKKKSVAPVLLKTSESTGIMRGRDVREKLNSVADPQVVAVIAKIAEINHTNCTAIAELATMMDQMTDIIQGFSDVAQNMKTRTDELIKKNSSLEGSSDYDVEPSKH